MRVLPLFLLAVLAAPAAHAQGVLPAKPKGLPQVPSGPGLDTPKDPGMKSPTDPGAVVEPPRTGNEDMVKVPKNVDPEMDDATPNLDRKNRKKLKKDRPEDAR